MKIALIDGNNLAFKIYSSFSEGKSGLLKNSFGVPTTVIFGLFRTFSLLAQKTKFNKIIICWDISGSYYRRGIYKLYKKHRKYKDMKDYFEELDSARKYLEKFGLCQATVKGIEADDVIGYLAHKLNNEGNKVVVVSDDKDFYQIVKDGVKIYRPIKDEFINEFEVKAQFGMEPRLLPRIKAITGEDGDFIPGICKVDKKNMKLIKVGLGEKNAIKILQGKKCLADAIDNCTMERWSDILKKKKKMILKSYKLARIRTNQKHYKEWEIEGLKEMSAKVLNTGPVKMRNVIRLKNDLEIESFNVPFVLKRLGVELIGKAKKHGSGSEIKT